jgi:hypothetical protein
MKEKALIREFGYLIEKIQATEFIKTPFAHLIIDDFLSKEHFEEIINGKEINIQGSEDTKELIDRLKAAGYVIQKFPGCTTSVSDYLDSIKKEHWKVDIELLEGFGIAFRLKRYSTPMAERLIQFLNLPEFKKCLLSKFQISKTTFIETAIQKYLDRYEISPHPDTRRKAATYMLNINPYPDSEDLKIHTYLLRFKKEREYIYEFWHKYPEIDRPWVPWEWCEISSVTSRNNSIVLFAPSNYSLHAVKLRYDHMDFQRSQVYGNLWYRSNLAKYKPTFRDLANQDLNVADIKARTYEKTSVKKKILESIPRNTKNQFKSKLGL